MCILHPLTNPVTNLVYFDNDSSLSSVNLSQSIQTNCLLSKCLPLITEIYLQEKHIQDALDNFIFLHPTYIALVQYILC